MKDELHIAGAGAQPASRIARTFGILAVAGAILAGPPPALAAAGTGTAGAHSLENAFWVWHPDADSVCHFRKVFTLDGAPQSAAVLVTADNGYELYVNGAYVGADIGVESVFWQSVEKYEIGHLLQAGRNVISARAVRLGGSSGLIAAARIHFEGAPALEIATDSTWRTTLSTDPTGYTRVEYEETADWRDVVVRGAFGVAPWGGVSHPNPVSPAHAAGGTGRFAEPDEDYRWPEGIIFVRGRVPQSSTPGALQAIWPIGESRAYFELDTIGPAMPGHSLWSLVPARPDGKARLLVDAGKGLIGSPSVSYDGRVIYFTMAQEGDPFYRIYRIPAEGGRPEALTSGPFNDFDPEPLPDGRIVFSSTRFGAREEYHGNIGRALFIMNPDGTGIHPITHHIVGDNEPRVTASGQIAFIRQDNFFERAKVETHIHVVRPDGTGSQILLGPDRMALHYNRAQAAENDALWLRHFGFGSPAPLPDGRVAALSSVGLVVSGEATFPQAVVRPAVSLVDISPLPDGRLLCTTAGLRTIGVLDVASGDIVRIFDKAPDAHSAVYLGARELPPMVQTRVRPEDNDAPFRTGFLIGQSVFHSKQVNADLSRVKAIRVLEGRPFALRAVKHPYAHLGVEVTELGTVPLAPDGSFYIEVPADRALTLQAVDAEGRSVINEMSWIYVRPGEQRSCVGCHSQRETAPPTDQGVLAVRAPPVPLLGEDEPHRFRGNNAANGGVLNLQFDRFREAASIDLHVQFLLEGEATEASSRRQDVERLSAKLQSADASERNAAAQRLAIFRDRSAASRLAPALNDASAAVRRNAALALASSGSRESVEPLLLALDDPDPAVAQSAHLALANLTGHDQQFNAYGFSEERQAGIAMWRKWLAANDWPAIEQRLIQQLNSGDPARVQDAIAGLGRMGGADAPSALRAFLERDKGDHLRATLAAIRALGQLKDEAAIELLARLLEENISRRTEYPPGHHEFGWRQRPVQIAGAAAEALGWIGTPGAEGVLIGTYHRLAEFWYYTYTNGDHDWLMGCHSSIPHFRIAEALDAMESRRTAELIPQVLRSIPIDTDRGLLFEKDSYETVSARLANRAGVAAEIIETCLAVLGDPEAQSFPQWKGAVTESPPAVSVGPLDPESRAAQVLSIICLEPVYAERIREAFDRYRAQESSRTQSWTAFFLARTLGKLGDAAAVDSLIAALAEDATEASFGRVEPPNVFLHHAMSPYYRAAAAHALGTIGERRAANALIKAVNDFDNAVDVRHAAALALERMAHPEFLPELRKVAETYPEVTTRRILLSACERAAASKEDRRMAQTAQ